MKIFISQPMRNRTDDEILSERAKITEYLTKKYGEVEIIDSLLNLEEGTTPLESLGESIKLLAKADRVCFAPNFKLYNGCRVEYQCCIEYSKPIDYYREEK